MQVTKPDSFERLTLTANLSNARFHENVSDFAIVYGLGAQLLGEAKIRTNLLPRKLARAMAWSQKAKVFTIAALILLAVMLLGAARAVRDRSVYQRNAPLRSQIQTVLSEVSEVKGLISEQESRQQPLEEKISKEKERFKYRQVVPQFVETLVKCLPNKDNTPSQKDLMEAFERGDVQVVKSVARPERKQVFITRFRVEYANDLEKAPFPAPTARSNVAVRPRRMTGPMMNERMLEGMMPAVPSVMPTVPVAGGDTVQQAGAGFTVLIEGYSPYQNIAELLDPPRAGDDQGRWGIITRFVNLPRLFPSSSFELFRKSEIKHFKVETGLVDPADRTMPPGIGFLKQVERPSAASQRGAAGQREQFYGIESEIGGARGPEYVTTEPVLFDPMTGEEISQTYDIVTQEDIDAGTTWKAQDLGRKKTTAFGQDEMIKRDSWFRIQAKFVWKEAPQVPTAGMGQPM
jgi:hypothetical protein